MTIDEIRKAQEDGFRFTVTGGARVAYWFEDAQIEHVEVEYEDYVDEEGNQCYGYDLEERATGMVYMVMVGDDYRHLLDPADVEIAPDYCHVCGQIGCTHDGMERE